MDLVRAFRVFVAVVECESFASAARRLTMSRASTTRVIADLEERLSSRLLNRTSRQLSLTEAGRRYIDYCRQVLDLVEEADEAASSGTQAVHGQLRVCAPVAFGSRYLARAIPLYLAKFPEVEVELELHDREVSLVDEGFDLAIRVTRKPDPSLIAMRIASLKMVVCASPAYLARHGRPERPQDLKNHNCLVYSRPPANTWSFRKGDRNFKILARGNFYSNSGHALLTAALAGQGVIRLSALHVHEALQDGRLEALLPDYTIEDNGIFALYTSRKFQPQKVRTFIDFLRAHFRGGRQWVLPERVQ